jgi:hypothetical protein
MKRLAGVLAVAGGVLVGAVMVCGIAFQVFNGGDVPEAAWIVMSIAVAIGFACVAILFITQYVEQVGDWIGEWWYFRRWFKE